MRRFKCTIQYDGTDYSGYQVQPNGLTIQEVLEKTLERIHKHPVKVIGSGRTDARVHAQGQVIHPRGQQLPRVQGGPRTPSWHLPHSGQLPPGRQPCANSA